MRAFQALEASDPLFAQAVRGSCGAARVPDGQCLTQYKRLDDAGELSHYLVVEYRCAASAGCVLARVFTTPSGTFVHKPAHTYTHSAGAAVRAAAGYRTRTESAYPLPAPSLSVVLTCDHAYVRRDVEAVLVDISLAHRRGGPTGRRIGAIATMPADTDDGAARSALTTETTPPAGHGPG